MVTNVDRVAAWRRTFVFVAASVLATSSGSALAQVQWTDGFETYANGQFPAANWANSGNTTAYVTNTVAASGSNSLYLYGLVGLDWAALAHRQFSYSPDLLFSFSVMNGSEPLSGLHQVYGTFGLNTGPSWTTSGEGLLSFGEDGNIHGEGTGGELSGPVLGTYSPGTWYNVSIGYDATTAGTVKLTYWVNGTLDGTYSYAANSFEGNLSYVTLQSGAGSAWFDNVSVTTVPEPGTLLLMGLGGAGLWLLRRRRTPGR